MKKGLVKYIFDKVNPYVVGVTMASSFVLPNESKAQSVPQELNGPTPLEVVGNPFSQPNTHILLGRNKLDWYGSGDVNNDEEINELDVTAIDTASNDRADIDGNGFVDVSTNKH